MTRLRALCVLPLLALGAACHRRGPLVAGAPLVADETPCWWTVFRSPLPLDTVATHLVNAFAMAGLTNAVAAQEGDTIRAEAGPTRLADRFGGTYAVRMVAFRSEDSTLYRYFVVATPPPGGWPPSHDSVTASGAHISVNPAGSVLGLCIAIANSSQNHGTAPKEPNGEESLPVWRRREPEPGTLVWPSDLVLADSAESKPLDELHPQYPALMQQDGVSAKLVAAFVVDTTGRVEIGSVRFLLDAPRPFAIAICDVLRKQRFEPVRRDGQRHPALVLAPYGFFVGGADQDTGDAHWARERPNVEALRAVIARTGLPNARSQLASRPGCG